MNGIQEVIGSIPFSSTNKKRETKQLCLNAKTKKPPEMAVFLFEASATACDADQTPKHYPPDFLPKNAPAPASWLRPVSGKAIQVTASFGVAQCKGDMDGLIVTPAAANTPG